MIIYESHNDVCVLGATLTTYPSQDSSTTQPTKGHYTSIGQPDSDSNSVKIAASVIGALFALISLSTFTIFWARRRKHQKETDADDGGNTYKIALHLHSKLFQPHYIYNIFHAV